MDKIKQFFQNKHLVSLLVVVCLTAVIVLTSSIQALAIFDNSAAENQNNQQYAYGYGGGGGGGYIPPTTTPAAPTPTATTEPLPPGTVDISNVVTSTGEFTTNVVASSDDNQVEVEINAGVIGQTINGEPVTQLTIVRVDNPQPPPAGSDFIGIPYDFGPDGATFDPPVTITFKYDVPAGTNLSDLVIAFYNESTGQWIELTDIVIDPATGTISGQTSHFTTFAVILKTTAPAPTQTTAPVPTQTTAPAPTSYVIGPTVIVTTIPSPATTPAETPINWVLIGILLAVVVIVAVGLPLYLRARGD